MGQTDGQDTQCGIQRRAESDITELNWYVM